MTERSLVAFTLLSQTAVGGFLALVLTRAWLISQIDRESATLFTNKILLGVCLLIGSSILASFFHLGSPINGWRAISNLRTSWLSREILFTLLFATFAGLFTGLEWFNLGSPLPRDLLSLLTVAIGLALVYSMVKVYTLRTVSAWSANRTLASFLLTTLLSGGLFFCAAYTLIWTKSPLVSQADLALLKVLVAPIYWFGIIALILISAEFLNILLNTARAPVSRGHLHRPDPLPNQLKMLSLALLLISAATILPLFSVSLNVQGTRLVFLAAFGLVMIAEIVNRIMFYESRHPEM